MSWPKRAKVKIIEKIVILLPPHFLICQKYKNKNDWNDYKPRNWIAAKWDFIWIVFTPKVDQQV